MSTEWKLAIESVAHLRFGEAPLANLTTPVAGPVIAYASDERRVAKDSEDLPRPAVCSTRAASFIWGINTLFLLDAGLSNAQAFAANAFFTAGLVLFEVPTGVIADMRGRRMSYLLGTVTLTISTLLYLLMWR